MKVCQISAGKVPPVTDVMPWTVPIGFSPFGCPIQTTVASCGTQPANHASASLSVVPVLPATGRPGSAAAVPVPDWTFSSRTFVTTAATFASSTRWPFGCLAVSEWPSGKTTFARIVGWCATPPAASVA